jgi:dCMP deaminase
MMRHELKYLVFMRVAEQLTTLSTCVRRQVGCVLLDANFKVLSTGYNGVPSGYAHCTDERYRCPGAELPSGQGLDKCEAIHAEQNALLQCPDVSKIHYCVVTCFPCVHCTKLLLNTGCRIILYRDEYFPEGMQLWQRKNRGAHQVKTV